MVLGSFALLKTTAHLQWCPSLCLPDEGSFPQRHHHTLSDSSAQNTPGISFNSSCAAEGGGQNTLQSRQEEEQGVTTTVRKSRMLPAPAQTHCS